MEQKKRAGTWFWLPVVLALCSCATQTRLETSWQLPSYTGGTFNKIAIIGIMRGQAESKSFEMGVVDKFSKAGIEVVPGFSFLDNDTDLSQQEMEKRVAKTGVDAVLLFKFIAVDKTLSYVPPTTYVTTGATFSEWWDDPYWGYYTPYPFHYWGYWYPATQVVATPGYWETHRTYRVEAALYRTSDNKLVWTATSDTYDPSGSHDLASSISKVILKNLVKDRLIQTK